LRSLPPGLALAPTWPCARSHLAWRSLATPCAGDDGASWLSTTRDAVAPATSGLYYFNYLDKELAFREYFGASADRLAEIKQKYDAGNYIQGWEGMPEYEGVRGTAADSAPDAATSKADTGKRNGTVVATQPVASRNSSYTVANGTSPAVSTIKVNDTASDSRTASPPGKNGAVVAAGATALAALLLVLQLALA
jgi:hypothetical protein